jgi:hypothetical protein
MAGRTAASRDNRLHASIMQADLWLTLEYIFNAFLML